MDDCLRSVYASLPHQSKGVSLMSEKQAQCIEPARNMPVGGTNAELSFVVLWVSHDSKTGNCLDMFKIVQGNSRALIA